MVSRLLCDGAQQRALRRGRGDRRGGHPGAADGGRRRGDAGRAATGAAAGSWLRATSARASQLATPVATGPRRRTVWGMESMPRILALRGRPDIRDAPYL